MSREIRWPEWTYRCKRERERIPSLFVWNVYRSSTYPPCGMRLALESENIKTADKTMFGITMRLNKNKTKKEKTPYALAPVWCNDTFFIGHALEPKGNISTDGRRYSAFRRRPSQLQKVMNSSCQRLLCGDFSHWKQRYVSMAISSYLIRK